MIVLTWIGVALSCSYFLNRKNSICVVTLKGEISDGSDQALEACVKEVAVQTTAYCVVNLRGVPEVTGNGARSFALFQQKLRQSSALLLCDLPEGLASKLKAAGLVRESELQPDLLSAIQYVIASESRGQTK